MSVTIAARRLIEAKIRRLRSVSGLGEVSVFLSNQTFCSYFRWKWGIKCKRGNSRNAGKVIRLNVPKTSKTPSIADERIDERSCSD